MNGPMGTFNLSNSLSAHPVRREISSVSSRDNRATSEHETQSGKMFNGK